MTRGFDNWTSADIDRIRLRSSGTATVAATQVEKKQPKLKFKYRSKTEAEYASILEVRKRVGEIIVYEYECLKLSIGEPGERCWYTPDFLVVTEQGTELHEVKGAYVRDKALVKWKAARRLYPHFRWVWAQKDKEGWNVT